MKYLFAVCLFATCEFSNPTRVNVEIPVLHGIQSGRRVLLSAETIEELSDAGIYRYKVRYNRRKDIAKVTLYIQCGALGGVDNAGI